MTNPGASNPNHFCRNAGDDGEQNPGNNLHVSGVSLRVTERDLDEAFGKFGKVSHSSIYLESTFHLYFFCFTGHSKPSHVRPSLS